MNFRADFDDISPDVTQIDLSKSEMKIIKIDEKLIVEDNESFITISNRLNPDHFIRVSYGMELHNLIFVLMYLSNSNDMDYPIIRGRI